MVLGAIAVVLAPATATASCAGTPTPSPYAFVGTVERTESGGRIAFVRTEDGRDVTVWGGEVRAGVGSSVDRTYDVGATYEFHPRNDTSPFRDGACTATRLLSAGVSPRDDAHAVQPPADGTAGGAFGRAAAGILFGIVVLLLTLLLRRRRVSAAMGATNRG
jgi:hypothetical protein